MKTLTGSNPRILLIRFSSLGDVILATPVARALKEAFPGATVTFLTKKSYAPLLESHRDIDLVVGYGGRQPGAKGASLLSLCRSLGNFDAVADLHLSFRSLLSCLFVTAERRVFYGKDLMLRRLWVKGWMRGRMEGERRHVVDRYLHALRPLGVVAESRRPEIFLPGGQIAEAKDYLLRKGVADTSSMAVLVPGARWRNKQWGAGGFTAVGKWLRREKGLQPVIAGDVTEREVASEVSRALGSEQAVDVCGETELTRLAGILHLARICVGNDSGPGHLAAAVGTPVVTLFGPTSEAFGFSPMGERVRTVSLPLPCRPCSLHGGTVCPLGKRACLDDLPAKRVIDAVDEVLAEK